MWPWLNQAKEQEIPEAYSQASLPEMASPHSDKDFVQKPMWGMLEEDA